MARWALPVLVPFAAISASVFCVHGANAGWASHLAIAAWMAGLASRATWSASSVASSARVSALRLRGGGGTSGAVAGLRTNVRRPGASSGCAAAVLAIASRPASAAVSSSVRMVEPPVGGNPARAPRYDERTGSEETGLHNSNAYCSACA